MYSLDLQKDISLARLAEPWWPQELFLLGSSAQYYNIEDGGIIPRFLFSLSREQVPSGH